MKLTICKNCHEETNLTIGPDRICVDCWALSRGVSQEWLDRANEYISMGILRKNIDIILQGLMKSQKDDDICKHPIDFVRYVHRYVQTTIGVYKIGVDICAICQEVFVHHDDIVLI